MLPRVLCAGLLLAGLTWVGGCGGGSGSTGLPAAPDGMLGSGQAAVWQATVAPTELPESGGEVEVRAGVRPPAGAAVTQVWASVQAASGTFQVPMANVDGDVYCGSVSLPANTRAADLSYAVTVHSRDSAGNTYRAPSPLAVTVLATISQDGPPPPPPIPTLASAEVTPELVSYDGGAVTVAVALGNSEKVATVRAVIGGPAGDEVADLLRNGEQYRATLTVPANMGTDAVEYSVRVEARDAQGTVLLNQTIPGFAVTGPSPPPLPPFT